MIRSQVKKINSTAFLLFIFGVGVASTVALDLPDVGVRPFFRGETFRNIETHYQEGFPLKDWTVGFWAALQYRLFHEGRHGVVVGRNDWLYTVEEFQLPSDYERQWRENLMKIRKSVEILSEQGKTVIVLLLPEKVDIYRDQLINPSPHNDLGLYGRTAQEIQDMGIPIVTLKTVLGDLREGGEQVFLRTETHWTIQGSKAAAEAASKSRFLEKGEDFFTVSPGQTVEYEGDLMSFIPTGKAFGAYGPPPESFETVEFARKDDSDLFAEVDIRTALVGTSYSADKRWKFADWLQFYLHQEIANYARRGHGPFLPMEEFIKGEQENPSSIDQVIWEIPLRYLVKKNVSKETKS